MEKHYYIVYHYRHFGIDYVQKFKSTVTATHPFKYIKNLNEECDDCVYTLMSWRELTEEEYNIYNSP